MLYFFEFDNGNNFAKITSEGEYMQTITINVKNAKDAEVIILLAKRLDCKFTTVKSKDSNKKDKNKELAKIFKSIAKRGTLAKAIPDPVKWQKEIRKDRPLPGREN